MVFLKEEFLEDEFDDIDMNIGNDEDFIINDSEILKGPAPGAETGISNLIINAITDTWNTINNYNSIIATLADNGGSKLVPIIQEIINNETLNVGKLQKSLELVSPNAQLVDVGADDMELKLEKEEHPEDSEYDMWKSNFLSGLSDDLYAPVTPLTNELDFNDVEFDDDFEGFGANDTASTEGGYILDDEQLKNIFSQMGEIDD